MDKETKMFWLGFVSSVTTTVVALYIFEKYVTKMIAQQIVEQAIQTYDSRIYNIQKK